VKFATDGESFDSVLTFIFTFISVSFPFVTFGFLYYNREKIGKDERFDQKYGKLYEGLDTRKRWPTLAYMPLYTLKRLIFCLCVFFMNDHPYIAMIANVYSQMAYMIFVGWSQPFATARRNLVELSNETAFVDLLYLFFYFVNPATTHDQLYLIGVAVVTISNLLILGNIGFSFKEHFCRIRYSIRLWCWIYSQEAKKDELEKEAKSNKGKTIPIVLNES